MVPGSTVVSSETSFATTTQARNFVDQILCCVTADFASLSFFDSLGPVRIDNSSIPESSGIFIKYTQWAPPLPPSSIYHRVGDNSKTVVAVVLPLTVLLLMGFLLFVVLYRRKKLAKVEIDGTMVVYSNSEKKIIPFDIEGNTMVPLLTFDDSKTMLPFDSKKKAIVSVNIDVDEEAVESLHEEDGDKSDISISAEVMEPISDMKDSHRVIDT
eukprot:CAMPEP_0196581460 /NCGR_PEP_ID=MMETSP1081-20130531/33977_1 /TAXON_ID=36882 /ORGANISM="Pyramimonas amylifera, Strain CCMP720" /LENGTH=212 /DNA_ID=CAMNT_0041901697 /DNA_START=39 /DNA_END=677 /DNA_ORIENTATION=-